MGLLPSTPEITILPSIGYIDRPYEVRIELTAKSDTAVEFVDVRIRGTQGWNHQGAYNHLAFPELVSRVMEAGVLRKGITRLAATFVVPVGAAPSHELAPGWAFFELRVHVAVRRWLDARLRIYPALRAWPRDLTRTPIVVRSDAARDRPRLEVSLASTRLVPGETVHGRCAVFLLDDSKPRDVHLNFMPVLQLHHRGGSYERSRTTLQTRVTLPVGSAGTSVPFRFELPAETTPSFAAITHTLTRELVVTTGEVSVTIPIEVLDTIAARSIAPMPVPPELPDEHVAQVFAAFAAQRGWTRVDNVGGIGHSIARRDGTRQLGDAELRLACEYRGKAGIVLVGRAAYPSLGLDLVVTPASLLRNVLGDIEIDDVAWDRAHHVEARSAGQAAPFVRAVAPATISAALGSLTRWSDEAIAFERPTITIEEGDLAASEAALERVASAIEAARESIGPPDAADLEDWRRLASELRGKLVTGALALDGRIGNLPVSIRVYWARTRPERVTVSVGSAATASTVARELELTIAHPAVDAIAPSVQHLVDPARWTEDFVELRILDGVVAAAWMPNGVLAVARVRELVDTLHAIRLALEPATGPYR